MQVDPISILQKYWGFTSFKGSQEQIINAILSQQDVLALLPTGGGKSVCFQVPAMLQEGICIVVSPLIALIHDQVNNLKAKGIKAIALTGGISFNELIDLLDNCLYGNYKFLYLSPERLQQELVQTRISQMNVNLIAVDEAHCISQWGHDFRPAYLECANLRTLLPETPMIALTATATDQVATDIVDNLNFVYPFIAKDSFARKNIAFKVKREEDKRYRLKRLCLETEKSVIVYVRTRRLTHELSRFLNANGCRTTYFHGGISKKEKEEKLELWLSNQVRIIVSTNAFGMGVDKPDVQLVVHFQMPDCLENYFQEAGRAGRDGEPASAVLITNESDEIQIKNQFLSSLPDSLSLKKTYLKLNNYFQIAYGEGVNECFEFNFNDFVETYKLNSFLTFNALRVLDQNSVIALSESFLKKTTVRFLSNKEQIFDYLGKNESSSPIVQTILRTYGGIFDFESKINIPLIAKKTNVSESQVIKVLEQLQMNDIIEYRSQQSDLEITFLVPREDDRTIHTFANKVQERNQLKREKLEQMLQYVYENKICRSKKILAYFGEKTSQDCGICDTCLRNYKVKGITIEALSKEIMQLLKGKKHSSRALILSLEYNEQSILKAISGLLEDGKIKINTKNEYEIC